MAKVGYYLAVSSAIRISGKRGRPIGRIMKPAFCLSCAVTLHVTNFPEIDCAIVELRVVCLLIKTSHKPGKKQLGC